MPTTEVAEPRVAVCLYDFGLWLLQRTNRFPKNLRKTLGDQIDGQVIQLLSLVQRAAVRTEKIELLQRLNEEINVLRIQTRLCVDLGCLSTRQYEHAARQIDEIGRQVGGWLKQQRRRVQT